MNDYKKILSLDLEVSSLCNAECSVCNRRISGGPKNPVMIERAITLDEFKKWFPVELLTQLKQLVLCGNYGDPMTNPELISILTYFRELNPTASISMNTNAGGRDKKFWKDLSEIIGNYGRIVFSVDGLEDTNHLYRKGEHWDKVMSAMKTVTATKKVKAVWEFLVFEHNQHQISEARKMANELGMWEFWPKKAMGFKNDEDGEPIITTLNKNGSFAYNLYSPDDEWRNEVIKNPVIKYKPVANNYSIGLKDVTNSFNYDIVSTEALLNSEDKDSIKKLDNCEINCVALHWDIPGSQSVFVSSTGVVFPCCFTASKYYATASFETVQFRKFIQSYGEETITLSDTRSIKDVLQSDIMQTGFIDRWNKNSIEEGKLYTCGIFCGKNTNIQLKSTKESVVHPKTQKVI